MTNTVNQNIDNQDDLNLNQAIISDISARMWSIDAALANHSWYIEI